MPVFLRVLIPLLALLAAGLYKYMLPSTAPAADSAPLFAASFTDQHGQTQALSQWRGQVVVLNFWAGWCSPCREEIPELSALQDKYRAQGVTVVGLSTDDVAKVRDFAQKTPTSYPLLAGDFAAMQLAEQLGNNRGVLPYTVLLRRDGSPASIYLGRFDLDVLEQDVRTLAQQR